MRKLLNILYVTLPDAYLALDGETVVVSQKDEKQIQVPLHNLEGIVTFGYVGASPALMGRCAKDGISLTFLTPQGRYLARVVGMEKGSVLLRKRQFQLADSNEGLGVAKNCILGKLCNARAVLKRAIRDHAMCIDVEQLQVVSQALLDSAEKVRMATAPDELRGYEGTAASQYFGVWDELILQQKDVFYLHTRNRRPPTDACNAMLSFVYTILGNDVAAALEAAGLDPYVGFLHTDRPGRASLALDLMEELRPVLADRFVLTLINRQMVKATGFYFREDGAVQMDDETRKAILTQWQKHKQEEIVHPFLKEKIQWGLVPYVQAMLLARHLRGDLEEYPPFLWR